MSDDKALREHLLFQLRGGHAHASLEVVTKDFPADCIGARVPNVPYSAWQILEHMRISQWDILKFSIDASHVSPKWPDGYWPKDASPRTKDDWNNCIASFQADLSAMQNIVADPSTDLYAAIPHGDGQTILREALVLVDHNSYHLGQLALLRRLLGAWKD